MDSNQRSQDFHRAYADMMQDAPKEADAKVMAAETKAQPLEHELQVTEDESVQMMVRQEKMLDDKISEVKMTSPNHLELENDSLVAADKENLDLNERAEYPVCLEAIQIRNLYGPVPEVPSILLKSKEYNAYRTGCMHGIHPCILDSKLSQPNDASGRAKVEGDSGSTKDGCISCLSEVQTFDLILKAAKSAINTKCRKKNFASSKKIPQRLFRKLLETPVVTPSESTPKFVHDSARPGEDPTPPNCAKTSTKTSNYNKPIPSPELKTIEATSEGCSSLQLFKYTFQRKRKRETMRISDESAPNKIREKK